MSLYLDLQVTQITAYDSDSGANGLVFYKLGTGHNNKFYIDSKGEYYFITLSIFYIAETNPINILLFQ